MLQWRRLANANITKPNQQSTNNVLSTVLSSLICWIEQQSLLNMAGIKLLCINTYKVQIHSTDYWTIMCELLNVKSSCPIRKNQGSPENVWRKPGKGKTQGWRLAKNCEKDWIINTLTRIWLTFSSTSNLHTELQHIHSFAHDSSVRWTSPAVSL